MASKPKKGKQLYGNGGDDPTILSTGGGSTLENATSTVVNQGLDSSSPPGPVPDQKGDLEHIYELIKQHWGLLATVATIIAAGSVAGFKFNTLIEDVKEQEASIELVEKEQEAQKIRVVLLEKDVQFHSKQLADHDDGLTQHSGKIEDIRSALKEVELEQARLK